MKKKKKDAKNALLWTWEFTKKIVVFLSVLYILNWLYSAVVIAIAVYDTGTFSYLDTLITETNETFRIVVGANVIKSCIENIFKYNDIGGKSKEYGESSIDTQEEEEEGLG